MDVSTVFKEVLHAVENSMLNYQITKTPFSANIAIKRSFVKFHGETPETEIKTRVKTEPSSDYKELDEKLKSLTNQKGDLEINLESEKMKVKALESELDRVKAELKNEKNLSNSKFKNQNSEINEMSNTIEILEEKISVKVKALKVKDDACRDFKQGKSDSEKRLNEALSEIKI